MDTRETADRDKRPSDRLETRRERLESYLDRTDLRAVWFVRPNGFAWLTGGSNVVDRDSDVGVAAAGYTRADGFVVVTSNVEADRLSAEELPAAFTVESRPWYGNSLVDSLVERSPTPAGADLPIDAAGFESIDPAALRQPLTDADVDAYERLGAETAAAIETICRELQPGDTEHEVAAGVRIALSSQGINAPVVLVGGADRARAYRHFTPTTDRLGDYAIVSVTAERGGLYASLTRTVAFDPPEWLYDRHEAAATVEASALGATQRVAGAGGTAADVFGVIQDAYDVVEYPDEWKRHHQGGAAGYSGREWIATPSCSVPIRTPMAYAWNPTVRGAKSEGTVLVTAESITPLTTTGSWPTIEVTSIDGETTIERPAPLES
ncbi:MAG: M24 family metallopeptidase [Halobacteriota archaeon]